MRYQLLGPFDVFDDAGRSLQLGGERQRALLALLVLHANEVVSTDRIIDSLWTDDPPDTAGNVIQVYVSRLRKALEPELERSEKPSVLLTRRPGYMLRVLAGEVDAGEFTQKAIDGRAALESGNPGVAASLLRSALDQWTGDPLADFAYEEFAAAAVTRLTEDRIGAIEELVDARLALGEHDQLIGELEELVDRHPFRERFWAQLMVALYRAGRQADALRAFRNASESLLDELGIDPGPELQSLEARILNQDPGLLAVISPSVHDSTIPLIGRTRHLAALADAVAMAKAGGSVLIRLIGEPGAGVGRLLDEAQALSEQAGLAVCRGRAFEAGPAGSLADQLTPASDAASAIILQDGHYADPSSIGRVRQQLMSGRPTVVVVGQIPLESRSGRALAQLASNADATTCVDLVVDRISRAELAEVTNSGLAGWLFDQTNGDSFELGRLLEALMERGLLSVVTGQIQLAGATYPDDIAPPLGAQVADLESGDRLVVESCAVAGAPLPLKVVSRLLGLASLEAVTSVDRLVSQGFLEESDRGINLSVGLSSGRLLERIGATRRSAVAGALATVWKDLVDPADQGVLGLVAATGGEYELAIANLIEAADRAMARQSLSEAQPLLEAAARSMTATGEDRDSRWGHVHLALAECHRLGGWPELAARALDEAIVYTDGAENVDAWGWAAQVASDRQDPTDAEWRASIGQLRAAQVGEPAKAASLISLQARVLNRIGFPAEADLCSERGQSVLEAVGHPQQRFMATYNQAWIHFDRGDARHAEATFAKLLERTEETDARRADVLAWQSRCLFRLGRVDEATKAADHALTMATRTGDVGPMFLSFMSRAEGATMFWHGADALEAATEMLGLVLQQLPAWENAARFLLAKAHLVGGNLEAAGNEAANAVDTCPDGVGGRRWRLASEALEYVVSAAGGETLSHAADQVVHEMLEAKWHEGALDLLIAKASGLQDPAPAVQAGTIAVQLGLASAAGRAVAVARQMGGPVDAMVSDGAERLVRGALRTMPVEWADQFRTVVNGV